jgi:hypothetical protein
MFLFLSGMKLVRMMLLLACCSLILYFAIVVGKGKGKVVPVLNKAPSHEGVGEKGGIAPCIL